MCGITGFYSISEKFNQLDLNNMTAALSHRGPDAAGYFFDKNVGLGHRRLSIIDLSTNANQPMYSSNERYVMVYNGEVYNYQEIANELKQQFNCNFKTSSDSEIILEAFCKYGFAFLEKLNGMFAIAIYDKQNKELFIFRDRIGIKPLYYFWDGESLAFASELKSLQQLSSIEFTINKNAVYHFLHLGFIPAPYSIYKSIHKLESGSWLKISNTNLELKKYWTINNHITKEVITDEKVATETLNELITSSVKYQIRSDVPFGVFLSGGIDSSLVSAKAANLSTNKINTFSIGFEESKFNESEYARAISKHLNTNHHEFIVSYKNAIDLIDNVIDAYDEPFADSSAIPTMLVSKLARKHVTVTLSGDGGDELFFGYGAHQWAKRLNNPIIKTLRKPIASILSQSKFERHSNYFKYPNNNLKYSHILSQEQYCFSLEELNELITNSFKNEITDTSLLNNFALELKTAKRKLNAMEKQAIFDLNFYLQDDLLTKVDRASMNFSLETRVPYLDHRIIEFALNLSPSLKYQNGTTKYLLKEILYSHVPKKLFQRPKQGFSIPLEKWLKNELRYLIEENLSKEIITKYNYVSFEEIEDMIKEFDKGKSHIYNRIWLLIILHKWLRKNQK